LHVYFCSNLAMFGFMKFYTEIYKGNGNKVKISRQIGAQGFHRNLVCIFVIFPKFLHIFEVGANF
jgi:hypothetical protein